jgi:hypothetical protein
MDEKNTYTSTHIFTHTHIFLLKAAGAKGEEVDGG